jgi:hypothetical protein
MMAHLYLKSNGIGYWDLFFPAGEEIKFVSAKK